MSSSPSRVSSRAIDLALAALALVAAVGQGRVSADTPSDAQQARAMLDRWLAAQNQRDFAGYEALYAASFTGVKRVGKVTRDLAREAWLADRKSMFRAVMEVTVEDVQITTSGGTAIVELTQRWEQGTFADVGRKRMVLDLHPSAGPILREEMLTSRPILARQACLRAVFPAAKAGRVGPKRDDSKVLAVATFDLGTERFGCRVEHRTSETENTNVAVAVVGRRGGRWTVLGQQDFETYDESLHVSEEGAFERKLDTRPVAISATERALLFVEEQRHTANMLDDGTRTETLWRATAAGWQELLTFESKWSDGEADDGTRCKLGATGRTVRGMAELEVECVTYQGRWHDDDPAKNGRTETSDTTTYRWNGTAYE